MYALCHHPGVIWMGFIFIFMSTCNDGLFMLIVYNDLNIIYVIIQDLLIILAY